MRLVLVVLLLGSAAAADETLRIGTIVPEGTGWARGLHTMAEEVAGDGIEMKFYMASSTCSACSPISVPSTARRAEPARATAGDRDRT